MSYGPELTRTRTRRAAALVDKILKGSQAVPIIPVEQPTKFELIDQSARRPRQLGRDDSAERC